MDELRDLAHFVSRFVLRNAPADAVDAARGCVLDTIGAALGAVEAEEIPGIVDELGRWDSGAPKRSAAVWGHKRRMTVSSALLVNAMLAHALELDDVHTESKSHIGSVVVPTAWTLADALGRGGTEFLEAVIVGYETMSRIGLAMDVTSNRKRGWHTTGVIGTFGAAAAAAHVLGLAEMEIVSAFGMAGTQSSGLWAFLAEGSSCKKLHPARAAVNGVAAALLAKAGMTGPEHILDAKDGGLFPAVSDAYSMERIRAGLGDTYEILSMDKKLYPCCRSTHHAIDAALAIRAMPGFDICSIERIEIKTYEVAVLQCGSHDYPRNRVEAKFSLAFTCAAAFVRGRVTLAEFDDETICDRRIRGLAAKIAVVSSSEFTARYPRRWGCLMIVTLKNREVVEKRIDDMSGSVRTPLTPIQEEEKFLSLASCAYGDLTRIDRCLNDIRHIDSLDRLPDLA